MRHSFVAAALGCCLLSAPTATADFDDLLDTVIGAAAGGADMDFGGMPIDSVDLADLGVLNDPLAQLDQVLHDTPGQSGLDEPASGPGDGAPDGGADHDTGPGAEQDHPGGNSNNAPSLPKFSMPGGGNGSGGSGGGPGGSGGSPGNGATKTKTNAGATKDLPAPAPEPQSTALP